jgi:hypothetical protein
MFPFEGAAWTLITVALTATIDATGERVWRSIVDPSERPFWDDRILGEIKRPLVGPLVDRPTRRSPGPWNRPQARLAKPSSDIPREIPSKTPSNAGPIRCTRWRFRFSGIPLVLVDETHRIEGHERLFGRISIGSMHFDQTITVVEERDESGPRTRLGMKLVASNSIAVIGELVPRLEVQRFVIEYVDTTLRLIRKHCEAEARSALPQAARR